MVRPQPQTQDRLIKDLMQKLGFITVLQAACPLASAVAMPKLESGLDRQALGLVVVQQVNWLGADSMQSLTSYGRSMRGSSLPVPGAWGIARLQRKAGRV